MKLKASFGTWALQGILALALACASLAARAQANSIESINVSPATGGRTGYSAASGLITVWRCFHSPCT